MKLVLALTFVCFHVLGECQKPKDEVSFSLNFYYNILLYSVKVFLAGKKVDLIQLYRENPSTFQTHKFKRHNLVSLRV